MDVDSRLTIYDLRTKKNGRRSARFAETGRIKKA